jgi:hypothetical protein
MLRWYLTRPAASASRARGMARIVEAARWLREHSPPTSGWLSPGPPPEYGVLGPWGVGHVLRYVAERPVVQDNFGDDVGREGFDAAEAYYAAESEAAGAAILEELRVRYVLVGPAGSGHGRGYGPASLLARLRHEGTSGGGAGAAEPPAAPLERHRLVYESGSRGPDGEPHWKLFEWVPAAPPAPAAPAAAGPR